MAFSDLRSTQPSALNQQVGAKKGQSRVAVNSEFSKAEGLTPDPSFAYFRRSAACASPLASAFSSLRTCEMENASERASFRQVQCRE